MWNYSLEPYANCIIKFKRIIKPFKAQTNNFNNSISL